MYGGRWANEPKLNESYDVQKRADYTTRRWPNDPRHYISSFQRPEGRLERYGLSGMIARRRAGLPTVPLGRDAELTTPPAPATASETVEDLPDHFFTQAPVLTQITTMTQRLALTDSQPVSTEDLIPPHRRLFIKRSQRCRECEHNICKPEFTPASIKFKIQLAAQCLLADGNVTTYFLNNCVHIIGVVSRYGIGHNLKILPGLTKCVVELAEILGRMSPHGLSPSRRYRRDSLFVEVRECTCRRRR
ncbi:Dynactin subunit 4 [Homalodisca vitripennis]|nr:Dynactin subunit 4 [Homalodisca vitripennis]